MKYIMTLAIFTLSTSIAFAGTIRGGSGTRSYCVNSAGENISVSPIEPPSTTWKNACKKAKGKIKKKGGLQAQSTQAALFKTKYRGDIKVLKYNTRLLKNLKNQIKKQQRILSILKSKYMRAARKNQSILRKLNPSQRRTILRLAR